MTVREHLIRVIIAAQRDAADLYLAVHSQPWSFDASTLLHIQDLMARQHACVQEGLDWLSDERHMSEWQARYDKLQLR